MSKSTDTGAESDGFRDMIAQYNTIITKDETNESNTKTTIEFINAEGDPPFAKYRYNLEGIDELSLEQVKEIEAANEAANKAAMKENSEYVGEWED